MSAMQTEVRELSAVIDKLDKPDDKKRWAPTDNWMRDFLWFVGPGWLVCVAYMDPGNYQADINAGATTGYSLLWATWWSSIASIFVQILCVRLGMYAQVTLSEAQATNLPIGMRYLNWFISEFIVVITDLPEVIGFGIGLNVLFGWPYWVGVLLSLVTTFVFLAVQSFGTRHLELIVIFFIGVMSISILVEWGIIGDAPEPLLKGTVWGFVDMETSDIFTVGGILGSVVMPHNLYLQTASVLTRPVRRDANTISVAFKYASWEPVFPVIVTFFVNAAITAIAAVKIFGTAGAADAGNTDFYHYIKGTPGSQILWGLSLMSAGQSSAITTTWTGHYIMDGFLKMRIPTALRAILTRGVAILPCVLVSVGASGKEMNMLVNIVNNLLAILLPFALTPLVRFNTSKAFLGDKATGPCMTCTSWVVAWLIVLYNCIGFLLPGGGWFGNVLFGENQMEVNDKYEHITRAMYWLAAIMMEILYVAWNLYMTFHPIKKEAFPFLQPRHFEDLSKASEIQRARTEVENQEASQDV